MSEIKSNPDTSTAPDDDEPVTLDEDFITVTAQRLSMWLDGNEPTDEQRLMLRVIMRQISRVLYPGH